MPKQYAHMGAQYITAIGCDVCYITQQQTKKVVVIAGYHNCCCAIYTTALSEEYSDLSITTATTLLNKGSHN